MLVSIPTILCMKKKRKNKYSFENLYFDLEIQDGCHNFKEKHDILNLSETIVFILSKLNFVFLIIVS